MKMPYKTNNLTTDTVLDSVSSRNIVISKKPKAPIILLVTLVVYFLCILLTIFHVDSLSSNTLSLLCGLFATGISIIIFYITSYNEKRKDYLMARKNALILSEMLQSINRQIIRINNGERFSILYPSAWFEYYRQCSFYLKYDYMEIITNEISAVDRINFCIDKGGESEIDNVLKERLKNITDSNSDFDIFVTELNLRMFAYEKAEANSWKQQKPYIEFDKFILDNYTMKIKELTIERLKNLQGTCDVNSMQRYIMEELRKEAALKSGKHKNIACDNKAVLKAIFEVYLKLNKNDVFSLCWGTLTLK